MANVIRLKDLKNQKNYKSQTVTNSVDVLFQILLIAVDQTREKVVSSWFVALFGSRDRLRLEYIDAWLGENEQSTKNLLEILAVVKAILHCQSSGLKETLADLIYTLLISDQWKCDVKNLARKTIAVEGHVFHQILKPQTVMSWINQMFECHDRPVPDSHNIQRRDFNCRVRNFFDEKMEESRQKKSVNSKRILPTLIVIKKRLDLLKFFWVGC